MNTKEKRCVVSSKYFRCLTNLKSNQILLSSEMARMISSFLLGCRNMWNVAVYHRSEWYSAKLFDKAILFYLVFIFSSGYVLTGKHDLKLRHFLPRKCFRITFSNLSFIHKKAKFVLSFMVSFIQKIISFSLFLSYCLTSILPPLLILPDFIPYTFIPYTFTALL